MLLTESRRPAKRVLLALVVLSPVWLWLYAPLAIDPGRWLSTTVVHHSIAYDMSSLPALEVAPRWVWRVAYLAFICLPLFVARPGPGGNAVRLGASLLVAALFAVSYIVFWYAFTSVWCFFAALVSLLLALAFSQLPRREVFMLIAGLTATRLRSSTGPRQPFPSKRKHELIRNYYKNTLST